MKIVQQLRGTTVANDSWLFPSGVFTYDEDLRQIRVHDGVTVGGHAIPNVDDIVGFGTLEFTAVTTLSVPGAIPDSAVGKLARITNAGTYVLPTVVGKPIGSRFSIQALVGGVVIDPFAGQNVNELANDLTTMSISNTELVTLAVLDASKWIVVSRH